MTETMERLTVEKRSNAALTSIVFAACALIVAALIVGNQTAVHWRSDVADDHLYAYGGWRIWQGARPYIGVWDNKPPGIWWVNALGFAICGEGVASELLVCSAALVIAIASFAGAARRAYGRGILIPAVLAGAALLTDMRYECGANRTETYVTACGCLAVYGYVRWLRTGRIVWLALAGLSCGAAPCFKQNGAAVAVACGVHLVWITFAGRKRRSLTLRRRIGPIALFGGALAAVPAAVAAYLLAIGALGAAWFAVVQFNRYFFLVGDASWTINRGILDRYAPVLKPLREIAVVAAIGLLWGAVSWMRRRRNAPVDEEKSATHGKIDDTHAAPVGVGVFLLWLLISSYLACVGTGRMAYHLAPILAPLGLLALYPLARFTHGEPLHEALTRRPSSAAALVVFLYVILGVFGDSLGYARKCWMGKPTWMALRRSTPAEYELQAAAIRKWTTRDDEVYVWGWSPGTYRFAYRKCPSRYATIEHVSHVAPYGDFIAAGARRDVRNDPPAVFVISIGDYEALQRDQQSNFTAWFNASYALRDTIAGMRMFVNRRRFEIGPASRPDSSALRFSE